MQVVNIAVADKNREWGGGNGDGAVHCSKLRVNYTCRLSHLWLK